MLKQIKRIKQVLFLRLANILPVTGWKRASYVRGGGVNAHKGCWIGRNVHFDSVHPELITIEKGAIITMGTKILTHYIDTNKTGVKWRKGKVHIQQGAFIGCNTIICNSVTIGKGAIIGAGSIVTKDIPPYQVWAGNPAKYVKDRAH